MIYLDYAATHPLTKTAKKALEESYDLFANPSSPHHLGKKARAILEQCRQGMSELLLAKKTYDLIFTSSATESNNMAILGLNTKPHNEILFSETFHPSLVEPLKKTSTKLIPIPLERGVVTPQSLARVLSEKTQLVLLEHVNHQSGLICDIEGCGKLVGNQAHVHVDAAQSFTKLPLSLKSEAIDSLSLSGHKIGAPKGVAALVLKRYTLGPLLRGGGQERGLRSGTENLLLIRPFYQCALEERDNVHLRRLKQQLVEGLGSKGVIFPFEQNHASDHICTFLYPQEPAFSVLKRLDENDIFISQTSACTTEKAKLKGISEHFGLSPKDANHILRVSLSVQSTSEEVQRFLEIL